MGGIIWGLVLVGIIATVVAVLRGRTPSRRLAIDEGLVPVAHSVTQRTRLRNMSAVVASAVVAILIVGYATSVPADLGRLLFSAPLAAASAGIVFFGIVPAFRERSPRRSADLAPRTALTFGKARWFVLVGALAAVLVATSVALGVVAAADGRSLSREGELWARSGGPFPGFFYSGPSLVALGVLAAAVALAIVRISRAPQPGEQSLREADRALKQRAVGVVLRAAATGCAATIAAMLIPAGVISASLGNGQNYTNQASIPDDVALLVAAGIEVIGGAAFAVLAIVLAVATISAALRAPLAIDTATAFR